MALTLGVESAGGNSPERLFAWVAGELEDFAEFGGMQNLLDVGVNTSKRGCRRLTCGLGAVAAAGSAEVYCGSVICSERNNNEAVSRFYSAIVAVAAGNNVSIRTSDPVCDLNRTAETD